MRVAIVGFGPKGLFALERLLDHATALPPTARLDDRSLRAGSDTRVRGRTTRLTSPSGCG